MVNRERKQVSAQARREGGVVKKSICCRQQKELDPHCPSHLFLLRVWIERDHDRHTTQGLAGKVQDPVTGQVRYYRRATELVRILLQGISEKEASGSAEVADQSGADDPVRDTKI